MSKAEAKGAENHSDFAKELFLYHDKKKISREQLVKAKEVRVSKEKLWGALGVGLFCTALANLSIDRRSPAGDALRIQLMKGAAFRRRTQLKYLAYGFSIFILVAYGDASLFLRENPYSAGLMDEVPTRVHKPMYIK